MFGDEIRELREQNLLRQVKVFESSDGRVGRIGGKDYLIFCSNDYLGLSHSREIIDAIHKGLEEYGAGSGASRLVSGTLAPHRMLEERLRDYLGFESALLFNSGYAANTGVIPSIAGKGDVILGDRLNHASIVDGCLLSRAEFKRYPHLDMSTLEKLLLEYKYAKTRWIVTDGLFSMDGDIAPLAEICQLADKYNAKVYLDDAHAFGILGKNGRGTAELLGVERGIDIHVGTLGKAAGVAGAFAGGSREMTDFLMNRARSFIFSTSLPPALALGGAKGVEILSGFSHGREMFLSGVKSFHNRLGVIGLVAPSNSYIIPLVTEDAGKAVETEKVFWERNIYLQAIRPPTVPKGSSRLRLTLSLNQTSEDREKVLGVLKDNQHLFAR